MTSVRHACKHVVTYEENLSAPARILRSTHPCPACAAEARRRPPEPEPPDEDEDEPPASPKAPAVPPAPAQNPPVLQEATEAVLAPPVPMLTLQEAADRSGVPLARLRKAVRENVIPSEFRGKALHVEPGAVAEFARRLGTLPAIFELRLLPESALTSRLARFAASLEEHMTIAALWQGTTRDALAASNGCEPEDISRIAEDFWQQTC